MQVAWVFIAKKIAAVGMPACRNEVEAGFVAEKLCANDETVVTQLQKHTPTAVVLLV